MSSLHEEHGFGPNSSLHAEAKSEPLDGSEIVELQQQVSDDISTAYANFPSTDGDVDVDVDVDPHAEGNRELLSTIAQKQQQFRRKNSPSERLYQQTLNSEEDPDRQVP